MRHEVIKGCVIKGEICSVGQIVDIDDKRVLDNLLSLGRVIPASDPIVIEDRSVELTDSAPKLKKRAKKK